MKIISVNLPDHTNETSPLTHPSDDIVEFTTVGFSEEAASNKDPDKPLDRGVLIVPEANYEYFEIKKEYGVFGEHIVLSNCTESTVRIGDLFKINEVLLEVTQPRNIEFNF